MTVTYYVEEVTPVDCEPDILHPLGEYDSLDAAVERARAYVPKPRRACFEETYARITVQRWKE
jgi:hypothetical protein